MAKCDDPIHSGGEERRSGPGADAKQAEGKFREQMDQDREVWWLLPQRGMGALKVRDISIPGNCEVGLTNAGHWGGAQVGALTRW